MTDRCRCGAEIPETRWLVGIRTCFTCGDQDARLELQAKQTRTGPAFNKGGLQYLGDEEATKRFLKEGGGQKTANLGETPKDDPNDPLPEFRTLEDVISQQERKELPIAKTNHFQKGRTTELRKPVIGLYWKGEDRYYLFEGCPPPPGATRTVIFRKEE